MSRMMGFSYLWTGLGLTRWNTVYSKPSQHVCCSVEPRAVPEVRIAGSLRVGAPIGGVSAR